jgi:hypothetical protein
MKPRPAATRRQIPGSPFNVPQNVRPVEQFEVSDRVTHDQYGLGTVIAVEGEMAVLVDFGSRQERIPSPFARLSKL